MRIDGRKTPLFNHFAKQAGLKIDQKKTETMILNITNPLLGQVNSHKLPSSETFTDRFYKTMNAFGRLSYVKKFQYFDNTGSFKIYHIYVLSTLLNEFECWRVTNYIKTLNIKCIRKMMAKHM